MKCIVELFGDDRNGRKMIAWGRRIGYVDAGRVCDAERRKVAKLFVRWRFPDFSGMRIAMHLQIKGEVEISISP